MINELDGVTSKIASVALDAYVKQENIIANNIANTNTEGFHAQNLDFESYLKNIDLTSNAEVKTAISDFSHRLNNGGFLSSNSEVGVKLDMQMAELSKTVLQYKALLTAMGKYSSITDMAISGGR